ncbi:glycosyltransferase family 39 protein [Actinoplanes sp. NBRC 101535]|uniref:glycosyltransferase family 39 protein n=1 Tax=Actinoplanes sp. NBRC 101535 TaxID=3032196 RepID=UPI0024A106A3|nr:glycosyltransferase family 39 protein [Actinoplanes sp. NBRC 101535]GLY01613.1 hypothetical protein Acsp01_19920 [Actinoplanes sp. NBRC 101535]
MMRATSTDQTAIIIRVTDEPEKPEEAGAAWTPSPEDLPAAPEPLANPRLKALSWVLPMVVATGLGLWNLATPGLSEEELATWGMVTASWGDFRSVLTNADGTVAPWYMLLRLWASIAGDTDLVLRLPSVLFGAGAAAAVALLGTRIAGLRVGLASGLLLALLPGFSRYAQDTQPYTLTMLAAAWSTYMAVDLAEKPRRRTYVGYAFSVLLLGLAHPAALLMLVAHLLLIARVRRTPRAVLSWLGTALLGSAPLWPLLYLGYLQRSALSWIPPLSLDRVATTPDRLFGATIIAGAVIALALTALSVRTTAHALTLWALVPVAVLAAVSVLVPLWVPRYLMFVLPAWALLAGLALRRLTLMRGLLAVLGIAALAVPAHTAQRTVAGHDIASRDVAEVIRANQAKGDAVLFGPYADNDQLTGRDSFRRYLAADSRPDDKLLVQAPRTQGSVSAQECPDIEVPQCFGKPARVWVVRKGSHTDILEDIGDAKNALLRTDFVQSDIWPLKGFTVALYTRKPAA